MTRHENKIQEVNLCRRACVYVRQSNLVQVHEHQESSWVSVGKVLLE